MAVDAARAKSLFLAASDLADPAHRLAYLDRECGGDAELRGRVEALLRANDAAPLRTVDSAPGQPQTQDYGDPTTRVGALLAGRYKLIEEIGAGGMGSVFMAQQTEPVKRAVAVKVVKAGMDSRAVLARFDAERQALALMDHPNIAKVLDAGTTDGGRPFFVMELVKGTPITRYCDERNLTPRQRLELFVPVCQAIQHAHQKGIIHRDIKPSNVLVALYDDRAVPKVIDFGVAKATGAALTDLSLMTGFGAVVGTPEYMSPEQASLNNLDIDTRSDVYSLGVLLYELLTGTTPVDRKSLGEAAVLEILRIVREVEAPRPSAKLSSIDTLPSVAANRGTDPARLSRLMRGELDWLVMKALEKDRSRRYDTANGLARDIQRYLADEVVEARPPSVSYRVSKFVRRHKGQVVAAGLVLLALLAGMAGTTWGLIVARQETAEKEQARQAEADRVMERDDALGKRDTALGEAKKANDELTHQLGVSAMVLAKAAHDSRDYLLAAERLEKVPSAQRGWEWRYLKRQLDGGIFTLYGHTRRVTGVAFSPDGTRIVTGAGARGEPFEAKVWDARTGMLLLDLKGLGYVGNGGNFTVVSTAFSADSKRIVTAGGDNTARVWDATTGALQLELSKPPGRMLCAAFSPDGTQIATFCGNGWKGSVIVWDARTGKTVREWKANGARLAFSADGTRIVTGGGNQHAVRVWDARTGTLVPGVNYAMPGSGLALSPDGTRLVTGLQDGTAQVMDATTGKFLLELKGRQRPAYWVSVSQAGMLSVAFSPDGTRIVSGGTLGASIDDFGQASVWDARTGAELFDLKGHTGAVLSAAFSPDGTRIITGSADGTAKVWDARIGTPRLELDGIKGSITCASISPDGTWVVAGAGGIGKPGAVAIWDARTGLPKLALKDFKGSVNSVAVSRDGTRIVASGGEPGMPGAKKPGKATVWDAQTGTPLALLKGLKETVNSVCFSPDGTRIVTAAFSEFSEEPWAAELKVFDARTGTVLLDLTQKGDESGGTYHGERGGCVAFSPDGRRFVVGGRHTRSIHPSVVQVLDAETGTVKVEMKRNHSSVRSVAFSPDGTRIATGGSENTATVWDAQTGTALLDLKGHTGMVDCVAFSPDGKRVVTGSFDRTVRVWDARTGTTLAELKAHTHAVTGVSFSADGTRLLTAGGTEILNAGGMRGKPGNVIVWDAPNPKPDLELVGHTARISAAAFSPDGTRLATSSGDQTVKVWDPRTGAALLDLKGHTDGVDHVAFSADGTRILSTDGITAKVWDAKTGSALLELKAQPQQQMWRGTFSPDGTRIVTAGFKPTVWDARTAAVLVELNGLPESTSVNSVSFSPDGTRLFATDRQGKALAWDARTGKELQGEAIPPLNRNNRISPDGRLLAHVIKNRVKLVRLVPDAEEIDYRRLHVEPDPRRYRAGYVAARAARDAFAAAFYLQLIPPDDRKQAYAEALAALSRRADEYQLAGKLEKALPLRIEILNVNKAELGPDDPATIQSADKLGNIYFRVGQFEKAIPLLEDVVKARKAKGGKEDRQTLNVLRTLGSAYKDAGRFPEAIALLEEVAAKAPQPVVTRNLLDAYALAGEHAKVVTLSLKLLAKVPKSRPEDIDQQADLLARLGSAYLGQKNWREAEPHLRECVTIREKVQPDDWNTFDAQAKLGGSLLGQKKYAEAEPLLLKGYEGMKQREKSITKGGEVRLPEALDRLIELYVATNKPDEAK